MAIDTTELTETLIKMRDLFIEDPTKAVRSKAFITLFQDYCESELRKRGIEDGRFKIEKEAKFKVEGTKVEADVGVLNERGEPALIVDVRSQMTSIGKNFNNYIRMKAGEVESIHEQFPTCSVGLVYLHPLSDLPTKKPVGPIGSFNYEAASNQLFLKIRRTDTQLTKYENVAYCVIDFNANPPKLSDVFPSQTELKLENFFDNIVDAFRRKAVARPDESGAERAR